jgi:hypothetical protein
MPLLGPEPALGIPMCSAREAIKNWIQYQHYISWKDLPVHRPADFAEWRLKQCSILFAAVRCWLVSAIMSLGNCLLNQKI